MCTPLVVEGGMVLGFATTEFRGGTLSLFTTYSFGSTEWERNCCNVKDQL